MDRYWNVDTTFCQLGESSGWTLELSVYDGGDERRRISRWIGEGPITENDLENMTIVWQCLVTARMNVQLGLDLGLIS